MSRRARCALHALEKARPASGFRPETEEEWARLQAAQLNYFAVMLEETQDLSRSEAERVARIVFGGIAGRVILEAAFREEEPRP